MLEFNTTLELKPNTELLELIKDFTYTINKEILDPDDIYIEYTIELLISIFPKKDPLRIQ